MRALILAGTAGLLLTACNQSDNAQEQAATEQNVETQVVATNDVTAIDAATGQAANMAADVTYMPDQVNAADDAAESNASSNGSTIARPSVRRTTQRSTPPAPAVKSAPAKSESAADEAQANAV